MYSLPSSTSAEIGPGSASMEVFLARRVRGMFSRRVVYALKTPHRMQIQLALRLLLHRFWRRLLLSRRRMRKKQERKILWQSEQSCLSHVRTRTAIELAGMYQDGKVRSDWMFSGFPREII